ncbi:hypothetical protein BAZOLSSOX_1906 [uncultured Gammaproteobacteria bacterium]|nr:hypothetical protein BAZOLSSOX_1906 [uncultured Gammaproteobacteria bacterium]
MHLFLYKISGRILHNPRRKGSPLYQTDQTYNNYQAITIPTLQLIDKNRYPNPKIEPKNPKNNFHT